MDPKDEAQRALNDSPVRPGQYYRHYKGCRYRVEALAINEADLTPVVVYEAIDDGGTLWVRPLSQWSEEVVNGKCDYSGPRFKLWTGARA